MPDTDRRTVRRPARPRKTTTRESETTMRELFAFIRAAVDLGAHKLKARVDRAFTDYRDPFDVELPELVVDGDAARDVAGIGPNEVTGDEVEAFLDRVARVTGTIEVHPSMVHAYLVGVLGIELQQWQLDLLRAYYGPQHGGMVHRRPESGAL